MTGGLYSLVFTITGLTVPGGVFRGLAPRLLAFESESKFDESNKSDHKRKEYVGPNVNIFLL